MANILNLALKKDIFEGLINKTSNEIPIDKTDWWKKRLMDIDTGRFKDFDTVRASCGSADKIDFPIDRIEDRDEQFVVIIREEKPSAQNLIERIKEDTEFIREIESSVEKKTFEIPVEEKPVNPVVVEPKKPVENVEEPQVDENESNVKDEVKKLFEDFCSYEKVYMVNMPSVLIRRNGQIMGCNRSIFMKADNDIKIQFEKIEIVKYKEVSDEDYLAATKEIFDKLITGNIVFIRKGHCGFTKRSTGEDVFVMNVAKRKTYLFKRMA